MRPGASSLPSVPTTGRHSWRWESVVAGAGILLGSYDLAAISVALDPLRQRWHLSAAVVTTLGTASLVGMLFGSLAAGLFADRFGRRRLVVADAVAFVVTTVASAAAPDFAVLVVARLGTGLAVGTDFAVVFPFVAETAPRARGGRAMAWIMWAANFGTLAAYGAGAILLAVAPGWGWRATLALGAAGAIPLLVARRHLAEPDSWDVAQLPSLRAIIASASARVHRRDMTALSAATFCYQVGDQGLGLVLPFLLATVLATSAASGAAGALAVKAVTIPASTLAVVLIEVLGRRRLQVVGFLGRGATLVALGVALLVVGRVPGLVVGGLLATGYLFGAGGPDKTTVIVPAEAFPSEVRSTGQGVSQAAGRLGGIVGVTAYGLLAGFAGPGAGLVVFGAAALAGAAVSALIPTGRPGAAPGDAGSGNG